MNESERTRQPLAVVVMAKHPTPGRVKTRLQPALSPEHSARLHGLFLRHLLTRLTDLRLGGIVLCYDPPSSAELFSKLLYSWGMTDGLEGRSTSPEHRPPIQLLPQVAGDLGARLSAAAWELRPNYDHLLFLGCDSPDVPTSALRYMATDLQENRATIAPTDDGGFWGVTLPADIELENVLTDIAWSSGGEFQQTVDRLRERSIAVRLGPAWQDVDHPQDLAGLLDRCRTSDESVDRQLWQNLVQYPEILNRPGKHA